uniref:PKS_AT domain-containing protein n=1 Tax=Strongyloides stercoralis TaxID=6248 RepID=A0A0K0EMZ7_STRER
MITYKLISKNKNTFWRFVRGIRQRNDNTNINTTTPTSTENEPSPLDDLLEGFKDSGQKRDLKRQRVDQIDFSHIPIEKQVVIFCPGQGTQTVGMLKKTKEENPKALRLVEEASEILGYNLQKLIDEGPSSKLNQTIYTQPAVVVSSMVGYENLKLLRPGVEESLTSIAGYSVGEYTAAIISGVLSFSDAIKIIKIRSEVMHKCCQYTPSKMIVVSVKAQSKLPQLLIDSKSFATENNDVPLCEVASDLFTGHKVIGMSNGCYEYFNKYASNYDVKLGKELAVEGAFHTRLMSEAVEELTSAFNDINVEEPFCNFYSNLTGKVMPRKKNLIKKCLVNQVCNPIKWEQIQQLIYRNHKKVNEKYSFPMYFEVGPGRTLGAMWANISKKAYKNYVHISC